MEENKEDLTVEKENDETHTEVEVEVNASSNDTGNDTENDAESQTSEESNSGKSEEDSYKSKFYYLAAEMENMKKRFERDKDNLIKFGNEKVLSGLLDVVDNLDRTVDAIATDNDDKIKNIYSGIEMVRTQFLNVLKANGLEQVKSLGEIFDPNFHEALGQQAAEGKEDQEIIQVYQHGYTLNGRLLRAAKVVIAKNN